MAKQVVTIIIPVYNEANLILRVLERVSNADSSPYAKEILVINDGSTDGTGAILDEYGRSSNCLRIIHLQQNRGKGAAIKAGLVVASGDVVLIQDADLEYSPGDYKVLLSRFADDTTQVVYGSRFLAARWPDRMKLANWLANKLFTNLVRVLYDSDLTDEGTAYKLFRREMILSLQIESTGFEFCPEVTAKVLKKGCRIVEVPISYSARDKKAGKKPRFIDGLKILWKIIQVRFVGLKNINNSDT